MECNSDMLSLKCAESIKQVMDKRHGQHNDLKKSFSDIQTAPYQLFSSRWLEHMYVISISSMKLDCSILCIDIAGEMQG